MVPQSFPAEASQGWGSVQGTWDCCGPTTKGYQADLQLDSSLVQAGTADWPILELRYSFERRRVAYASRPGVTPVQICSKVKQIAEGCLCGLSNPLLPVRGAGGPLSRFVPLQF
jgi:hypothetical protein